MNPVIHIEIDAFARNEIGYSTYPDYEDIPLNSVLKIVYPYRRDTELMAGIAQITLDDPKILDWINGKTFCQHSSWVTVGKYIAPTIQFIYQSLIYARQKEGIYWKQTVQQQQCADRQVLDQIVNPTMEPGEIVKSAKFNKPCPSPRISSELDSILVPRDPRIIAFGPFHITLTRGLINVIIVIMTVILVLVFSAPILLAMFIIVLFLTMHWGKK